MSILLQRATGSNGHTPPIGRLLPLLQGVTKTANGWDALCPAHADTRPSLGVAVGADGTVLLRCRSRGCTAAEIAAALGLSVADLFPPARAEHQSGSNGAARRVAATYPYRDEQGKLLFEVVRFEPKDFRQRRPDPDGKGGWRWSVAGVRRVPYRLPELLAAEPDWPCLITEGEKDADALAALGLLATTCPGGAGKWGALDPDAVRRAFAGRPMYVLVDNDDAGRAHAADVARRLHGIAKNIRVVDLPGLPPKGDVSDWLAAGHTRDELTFAADDTPEWSPPASGDEKAASESGDDALVGFRWEPITSAEFAAREYKQTWLVKRLLVANQLAVVGAARKSLKTCLMVDLALSLGSGAPFLGHFSVYQKRRVALISGESGEYVLKETALRICRAKGVELAAADVLWGFSLPQLANAADVAALADGLKQDSVEVLIVDPLYLCLLAGASADGLSSANAYQIGPLLLAVNRACARAGATLVLVHHATKPGSRKVADGGALTLDDLTGAGVAEACRQWLLLWAREPFDPETGRSALTLSVGGSAGQSGEWAVDVAEGLIDESFAGRKWEVTVTPAREAREARVQEREAAKRNAALQRDAEDDTAVMAAIDAEGPEPMSYTSLRRLVGLHPDRMSRAIARLKQAEALEDAPCVVTIGSGAKRTVRGLRRRPHADHWTIGTIGPTDGQPPADRW